MAKRRTVKKIEAITDLTPDSANVNTGTERGRGMVDWSLTNLGAGRSILADAEGVVIAGNKTLEVAAEHNLPIRVVQTDGKELIVVQRTNLRLNGEGAEREQARQMAIVDNRANVVGYFEDPAALLTHQAQGIDISAMYREDEIAALMHSLENRDMDLSQLFAPADKEDAGPEMAKLVLEFPPDQLEMVQTALLKHGATYEDAICRLLGL